MNSDGDLIVPGIATTSSVPQCEVCHSCFIPLVITSAITAIIITHIETILFGMLLVRIFMTRKRKKIRQTYASSTKIQPPLKRPRKKTRSFFRIAQTQVSQPNMFLSRSWYIPTLLDRRHFSGETMQIHEHETKHLNTRSRAGSYKTS